MTDRKESAADIEVKISPNETISVETLTVTEEFDVEVIYGSGFVAPSGYAIKRVSFSGEISLYGNKKDLKSEFFTYEGGVQVPKVMDALTINHMEDENGERDATSYLDIIVTNKGYEVNDGETTMTNYSFVAMGVDDDT